MRHVSLVTDEIWVLTDGRPGHVSQTLGLAEALTSTPIVKVIGLRAPFRQASPFLGWAGGRALTEKSAPIAPPWPKLVITSGRSAIPIALAIRRLSRRATYLVNVQDPGYFRGRFDLIVVPEHDELSGPNILSTAGALGRVTPKKLADAAAVFRSGTGQAAQAPHRGADRRRQCGVRDAAGGHRTHRARVGRAGGNRRGDDGHLFPPDRGGDGAAPSAMC